VVVPAFVQNEYVKKWCVSQKPLLSKILQTSELQSEVLPNKHVSHLNPWSWDPNCATFIMTHFLLQDWFQIPCQFKRNAYVSNLSMRQSKPVVVSHWLLKTGWRVLTVLFPHYAWGQNFKSLHKLGMDKFLQSNRSFL
jgi:hypothetical protein